VIVTIFLELFLSASGRAPAAIVDRLSQAAALFNRPRKRRRRVRRAPPADLRNNHMRRDIGLPPVDTGGWLL
jgi:hypothetical protein